MRRSGLGPRSGGSCPLGSRSTESGSAEFGSVEFGSVEFGSVEFAEIRSGSAEFGSVEFAEIRSGSIQPRSQDPRAPEPGAVASGWRPPLATRRVTRRALLVAGIIAQLTLLAQPSSAFPHVVQAGDTLAKIAERYYGRIQLERVVAVANGFQGASGRALTPGLLLEIPAVTYHQVVTDETWKSLARTYLGSEKRHITLAQVNGQKPWIDPEPGQMVRIPYSLPWLASGEESLATLAYRFLGSTKHAYQLVVYNDLSEDGPKKGQVLLLPLSDLPLTDAGMEALREAAARMTEQSQGGRYTRQKQAETELRQLAQDVRSGRYVAGVELGSTLLARGALSTADQAKVQRELLEAFVALGVSAKARAACQAHLDLADVPDLDPIVTSPKVLEACKGLVKSVPPSEPEAEPEDDEEE